MRYPKRIGRLSVPGRKVQLATAAMLLVATTVAACGDGEDDGAKASAPKAPATIPELTKDPLTLSFIWFEWPPAHALEDFANAEYKKERPNVTIKVNTVPNANWHDAMFTQFAARKTDFDIAILDSQHIGEAVTNGNILDITDFVNEEHRRQGLQPVPPGGLRPVPPGGDRQARRERQPVRTAAARRHLDDDLPQGPDRRQAAADLGRDDLGRREVPGGQPRRQRAGFPPGQRLRRRGRHLQHGQRRLRRQPLGRQGRARSRASSTTLRARRRWTSWSTR